MAQEKTRLLDKKTLGRRLKKLRTDRFGADQSDRAFARLAGINNASVAPVEDGRSFPMLDTLESWLIACGTNLREFVALPVKSDFQIPFDYDPDYADTYSMLAKILNSEDPRLIDGIRLSLEMISDRAGRGASAARGSPQTMRGRDGSAKEGSMKHSERSRKDAVS